MYRYFNLPYLSPTIGMYFFGDEFVKFVSDLKHFCTSDIKMISFEESRHLDQLRIQGIDNTVPIALLDNDVKIVMLHYHTPEEAIEKWKRRAERVNWNNIIVKFSEHNDATPEHLRFVDELEYEKKVIFTVHDYGLKSQIIFKERVGYPQILDDTTHFRRYVNLVNLVNGKPFARNQ